MTVPISTLAATMALRLLAISSLVVFGLGVSGRVATAGPWSPADQHGYHQTAVNVVALGDRNEYAFTYYVESGFGGGWAFVGSVPIRFAAAQDDRPSGLAGEDFFSVNPSGGLRFQFLDGPVVVALQSEIALPLGGGATDFTNQLLAGGGLAGGQAFWQTSGGFRLRTQSAGHESLWSADIGVWLTSELLAMASGRGRYQVEADPRAQRAEIENRVGTQWVYRFGEHLDIGIEALYTFANDTVAHGISINTYVALRTAP